MRQVLRNIALCFLAPCALLGACEPAEHPDAAVPEPGPDPRLPAIAHFFPLVTGHIWQYEIETDEGTGMMVTRVTRGDASGGELQGPQGTKSFVYAADGVQQLGAATGVPVYVLKEPLTVGTTWRGQAGSNVAIVEVAASVQVPAGTLEGCIKTLEERGGDVPLRVATTFCPGKGVVLLEAMSGETIERVALRSYGPPIDLGPDGLTSEPPK